MNSSIPRALPPARADAQATGQLKKLAGLGFAVVLLSIVGAVLQQYGVNIPNAAIYGVAGGGAALVVGSKVAGARPETLSEHKGHVLVGMAALGGAIAALSGLGLYLNPAGIPPEMLYAALGTGAGMVVGSLVAHHITKKPTSEVELQPITASAEDQRVVASRSLLVQQRQEIEQACQLLPIGIALDRRLPIASQIQAMLDLPHTPAAEALIPLLQREQELVEGHIGMLRTVMRELPKELVFEVSLLGGMIGQKDQQARQITKILRMPGAAGQSIEQLRARVQRQTQYQSEILDLQKTLPAPPWNPPEIHLKGKNS